MALLGETFSTETLPQDEGAFDPVPAGEYTVTINEAHLQDTKAGTGQLIKIRLDITGPIHEGRVLWANLNIRNPSETAERIGRQQLNSVMQAIGLKSIQDTDELVGGTLKVKVSIRESEQYGKQNEVKGYKAAGGSMPQQPAQGPAAAQQQAQQPQQPQQPAQPAQGGGAASGKPPWLQ